MSLVTVYLPLLFPSLLFSPFPMLKVTYPSGPISIA